MILEFDGVSIINKFSSNFFTIVGAECEIARTVSVRWKKVGNGLLSDNVNGGLSFTST